MTPANIVEIDPGRASGPLAALAPEEFAPVLTGPPTPLSERFLVMTAVHETVPVGLALVEFNHTGAANLRWIAVAEGHRRKGIGAALLAACEARAIESRRAWMIGLHSSLDEREGYLALIAAAGWSEPRVIEYRNAGYSGDMDRLDPTWHAFVRRADRQGLSVTPLADITYEDRERLLQIETSEVGRGGAGYTRYVKRMDPRISLAIRENGVLQGWIIGITDAKVEYHHYISGYVTERLQRAGWLLAALDKVMRLQAEVYGPQSVALQEASVEYPAMMEFMKRRLTQYALWTETKYISDKRIIPEPAPTP